MNEMWVCGSGWMSAKTHLVEKTCLLSLTLSAGFKHFLEGTEDRGCNVMLFRYMNFGGKVGQCLNPVLSLPGS